MQKTPPAVLLTNLLKNFFQLYTMTRRVAKSLGKSAETATTTRINGQFTR
jgi:hypothetical protein